MINFKAILAVFSQMYRQNCEVRKQKKNQDKQKLMQTSENLPKNKEKELLLWKPSSELMLLLRVTIRNEWHPLGEAIYV